MALINPVYGITQEEHFWSKEFIKTMALKAEFIHFRADSCILYRLNELGTEVFMVYINGTLEIVYQPELMDTIL